MNDYCVRCNDTRSIETFDYDIYGMLYTRHVPCPECRRNWNFLYFLGGVILFVGLTFYFKT